MDVHVDRIATLLESVVVHANDAVVVTEASAEDGETGGPRVVYVNPAFTRMTGWAPEDIVGLAPGVLQGPATDRRQLERIKAAVIDHRPIEVELLNVRRDGVEFWVQISITPVIDESGTCTHCVAIQRDIITRKKREIGLQAMLDNSPDLMLILGADRRVLAVSSAADRVLGHDREALIGVPFAALAHPDDRARGRELTSDSAAPRIGSDATGEIRLRHRDGSWPVMQVSVADLDPGSAGAVVVVCVDLMPLKRA